MRAEIARIQQSLRVTTLYVTHDQVEAMTLGDRVAVLRGGVLQQTDAPQRLYDAPVNLFVASFVGSPPMNLLEAQLLRRNDGSLACRLGDAELELPRETVARRPALEGYAGRTIGLGIRPEHVREAGPGDEARLRGRVQLVEALGAELLVHVEIAAAPLIVPDVLEAGSDEAPPPGPGERATLLGRFEPDVQVRVGETVELGIEPRRLHFFDLETSLGIAAVELPAAALTG